MSWEWKLKGGWRGADERPGKKCAEINRGEGCSHGYLVPRHTRPVLDSILLQMPKLGDGKDPSYSWASGIWEECGWRRERSRVPTRGVTVPPKGFTFRSCEKLLVPGRAFSKSGGSTRGKKSRGHQTGNPSPSEVGLGLSIPLHVSKFPPSGGAECERFLSPPPTK